MAAGEKFSPMQDRPPRPGVVPATTRVTNQTGKERRSTTNLRHDDWCQPARSDYHFGDTYFCKRNNEGQDKRIPFPRRMRARVMPYNTSNHSAEHRRVTPKPAVGPAFGSMCQALYWSMIFSENRYPLFRITLDK